MSRRSFEGTSGAPVGMIFTLDEDLEIGSWMPTRLGSVGNFPTEELVAMPAEMGIVTGIDPEQVVVASHEIARMRGIDPQSHRGNGATRKSVMSLASNNPNMRYS